MSESRLGTDRDVPRGLGDPLTRGEAVTLLLKVQDVIVASNDAALAGLTGDRERAGAGFQRYSELSKQLFQMIKELLDFSALKQEGSFPQPAFASSFLVRMTARDLYQDAVARTAVGERITFAKDETSAGVRIAALNQTMDVIGWIPAEDALVDDLRAGLAVEAKVAKIIGGSGTFTAVFLGVTRRSAASRLS